MLSRSTILRDAHAETRLQMVHDGKRHPRSRRWASYRACFAWCLKLEWRAAKERLRVAAVHAVLSELEEAEADYEAAPTPRNVTARIDALRRFASLQRDTPDGREGRRFLLAEADDLAQAARLIPFTAPEPAYHAH